MPSTKEIHRQMADAWNKRDFEALRDLVHPDYSYAAGDGVEKKGPHVSEEIARMYADAFPDGRLQVDRTFVQGDTIVAEMTATGTHKGELMGIAPTNKPVRIKICNVIEMRDGRIYREREYMDMLAILTQLGVRNLPGQAAKSA